MKVDINKLKKEDRIEYLLKRNDIETNELMSGIASIIFTIYYSTFSILSVLFVYFYKQDLISKLPAFLYLIMSIFVGIFSIVTLFIYIFSPIFKKHKLEKEYFQTEAKK